MRQNNSIYKAARAVGVTQANISACISGRTKSAVGYQWRCSEDRIEPKGNIGVYSSKRMLKTERHKGTVFSSNKDAQNDEDLICNK